MDEAGIVFPRLRYRAADAVVGSSLATLPSVSGDQLSQKTPSCRATHYEGVLMRCSWLAGVLGGTRTPNLLIRRYLCGRPDPFKISP